MPIPLGILAVAGAGAGGLASSFDLLETTVLGSNTTSVTFSSLGSYSDYKHLQIRMTARSDRASTVDTIVITANSDTGANYSDHYLRGNGSAVESGAAASQNNIEAAIMPAASASANIFGAAVIDILDFSNTNKAKTLRVLGGHTGSLNFIGLSSGRWGSTSAITSITIDQDSGTNWITGSRFSLYGIK